MAAKEAASLLPTLSTSVKRGKAEEGRFPIKVAFQLLHISTTALIVCWLAFLTHSCIKPEAPQSDITRELMTVFAAHVLVKIKVFDEIMEKFQFSYLSQKLMI